MSQDGHRFNVYEYERTKTRLQKAMEAAERRKKYGLVGNGCYPMIDPIVKIKAQNKRNVALRNKRIKVTLPLVTLALFAIVIPQQPADACHIYSHWRYPFPQRCGVVVHHTTISHRVVVSYKAIKHIVASNAFSYDFPLPDLHAAWNTILDTPAQLELYQQMQRQKAIKLLSGQ